MALADPDTSAGHIMSATLDSAVSASAASVLQACQPQARQGNVLHIAGVINEGVHGFLGPATDALAQAGFRQTLIALDHPQHRHLHDQFPASLQLCAVPLREGLIGSHWRDIGLLVEHLCNAQEFTVVHIHGIRPWALGLGMGRRLPRHVRVFYTPHGSRSLRWLPMVQALSSTLIRNARGPLPAVIAAPGPEARQAVFHQTQEVYEIDGALDDLLFSMPRREARRPLLVAGDWDINQAGLEAYCQMAVMLGAQELDVAFNWIGHLSPYVRARLSASNVGTYSLASDTDLWQRLAPAWCHVAPNEPHGFPVVTATAMALGVPTVARDCPSHRELITHGENGFLYNQLGEALTFVSQLIDQPLLRAQMGQAARERAQQRWSRQAQQQALVRTYRHG